MKILIVYGTTDGQTRKIARFLADHFAGSGHRAILADASDDLPAPFQIADFDAILVAASLHIGHYQSSIVHFVKAHLAAIDAKPNAFLSVSLAAASDDAEDVEGLQRCLAQFTETTRWSPGRIHHAIGAFRFTEYDFFKRWAMKYIAYRRGASTDTSQDHELTDWGDLAEFADSFAAEATRPAFSPGS